jgi:drug/metabolite transporter (DMT)-like permease
MPQSNAAPHPILVLLALIAVQLLFGAGYVVSKILVGVFPPLVWASIRIIVSMVIMVGVAVFSERKSPRGWNEFFKPLIGYALLGMIINQSSFLVGLSHTTSTNSAILNTLIPIFTLAIVTLRGQEQFTFARGVGFIMALSGVLLLRKVEEFSLSSETFVGDALTVLNCLSYALFLALSKPFLQKHDRVWTTAWLFVYGSIGITALAAPDFLHFTPPVMTANLWACAFFAIVGTTLLTYFLNFWALAHARSSSVALFIYLQPPIAAAIAFFWMGEPITLRALVSSAMIFVGMLLGMNRS